MAKSDPIDSRAERLLRQHGLFQAPVNVEKLATELGARVRFEALEDQVSGFFLSEKGVSTIVVNKDHHKNRQRFTLAHECGHLVLHGSRGDQLFVDRASYFRDNRSSQGEHKDEIEANKFAAALLMPAALVREALGDANEVTDRDILRLAMQFGVSETAMTHRLTNLDFF